MRRENPFERLEDVFDELSHEFEKARVELGGEIEAPPVDVAEWDGEFVVLADLPGYAPEDIDVRVTDHTLHVAAEHTGEHEPETEEYLVRERSRETVSRSIPLPADVDAEGVAASYESGVLTVTVPKAVPESEETAGHRIEIQ